MVPLGSKQDLLEAVADERPVGQAGEGVEPQPVLGLQVCEVRYRAEVVAGGEIDYHAVYAPGQPVGPGHAATVLGDPLVGPVRIDEPVLDRVGACSAQCLPHLVDHAGAVFDAEHRFEWPPARSVEIARGVASQHFDVIAHEDHRPGLGVLAPVDGGGDVAHDGLQLLAAPVPGRLGGRRRGVKHRARTHLQNCRPQVPQLDPWEPQIPKKEPLLSPICRRATRPASGRCHRSREGSS